MNRRKISSGQTFFLKRVFPLLWFGILGVVAMGIVISALFGKEKDWMAFPFVLGMAGFGFVLMRNLLGGLSDEVLDEGDVLTFRKGAKIARVPLSNIINISHAAFSKPPRFTLMLREPCELGASVAFIPTSSGKFSLNPMAEHPLLKELILRVDAARRAEDGVR